ncbi:MAG: transporter ATP-binding protein, partial [Pseudarthrobacter sp.]|nr:transporter ATP-binding protein [Pseudarthrobacter sp.]
MLEHPPPSAGEKGLVIRSGGREWSFSSSETVRVGRDALAQVHLDDDRVSREHLKIRHSDGLWWVADQASHNGTWILGPDRAMDQPVPLPPGGLRLRLGHVDGPELQLEPTASGSAAAPRVLTIGRSRSCDVTVNDPLVSRRHAVVEIGGQALLRDAASFNGTFLNGKRVQGATQVNAGDLIGVGTSTLTWDGSGVVSPAASRPVFSARHLEITTKSGDHLIDDLSMTVPAGQLVAVIGPSGAGKSTLLGALTGLRPATRGKVTWNGR